MNLKVIGTGSSGNSFLFEDNLIVDVGLSFKKINELVDISKIEFILLTHIHGDHFNVTAIRKLFVNTKALFVCGVWLLYELLRMGFSRHRIKVVKCGEVYNLAEYKISPILAYHDVDNCGYRIMLNNHKHFHITDTNSLDGISALNYDSASIECNHCIHKALQLIQQAKSNNEFTHITGAIQSHLSVQKVIKFCEENKIKRLTPIHIGESTKKEVLEALRKGLK